MSKITHPYEKKQKSLQKDCRNTYGENDKSSRKAISQNKARQHRAERKAGKQPLQSVCFLSGEQLDEVGFYSLVKSHQNRLQGFKKWSDEPLGVILKRKNANND